MAALNLPFAKAIQSLEPTLDGAGSAVGPPPLGGIDARLEFGAFRQVVLAGRAEMPAFPDLAGSSLDELFAFLSSASGTGRRSAGG